MHQILIAAAQTEERKQLCQALRNYYGSSCAIHEAKNGFEAVKLFHQHKPNAAILDIQLPDISGLDAARRFRSSGSPCAILFLTSVSTHSQAREVISLGAMDYLLKPFSEKELLQSLEQALKLHDKVCDPDRLRICHPQSEDEELLTEARLTATRENIESYLREHYGEELSMQSVAKAMNYSEAYFCKLFKQCFHLNFTAWLNWFRVEKAKELLPDHRLSIRDVSLLCGYTDANYFSRVFKRLTGRTPSEYRIT